MPTSYKLSSLCRVIYLPLDQSVMSTHHVTKSEMSTNLSSENKTRSSNQRCKISWHFLSVKVYDKVFNNFQSCEILQKELRVFLRIGADNTWSW